MHSDLTGKSVVLGVTGGIAAYKACEVVSRLRKMGADVYVIMTKSATEFVQPLTGIIFFDGNGFHTDVLFVKN
jgi:phosphopantothenoylcysteine synthetase/decarboxylase